MSYQTKTDPDPQTDIIGSTGLLTRSGYCTDRWKL